MNRGADVVKQIVITREMALALRRLWRRSWVTEDARHMLSDVLAALYIGDLVYTYPPAPTGVPEQQWRDAVDVGYEDRYLPLPAQTVTDEDYARIQKELYGDD